MFVQYLKFFALSLLPRRRSHGLVSLALVLLVGALVTSSPAAAAEIVDDGTGQRASCVIISEPGRAGNTVLLGDVITYRCVGTEAASNSVLAGGTKGIDFWRFSTGSGNFWLTTRSGGSFHTDYVRVSQNPTAPIPCDVAGAGVCFEGSANVISNTPSMAYPSAGSVLTVNTVAWSTASIIGTDSFHFSDDLTAVPLDYYTSAALFQDPPVYCDDLNFGLQLDGDPVDPADYDSTFVSSVGADLIALATRPGSLSDLLVTSIMYRWGDNGLWTNPAGIDQEESGGVAARSLRVAVPRDRYLADLQIRCIGPDAETRFLDMADPGTVNDPLWSDELLPARACRALTLYEPQVSDVFEAGETIRVGYVLSGTEGIDLKVWAPAQWGDISLPGPDVRSYSSFGQLTGGVAPFVHEVAAGKGWIEFEVPSGAEPTSASWLIFSCTDDDGSVVVPYGGDGRSFVGTIGGSNSSCWGDTGISVTNPSSWLTGFGSMLSCLAGSLFVPEQSVIYSKTLELRDELEERPPFFVVSSLVSFGATVSSSFQNASGTGCFDAGPIEDVVSSSQVCVGDGISVQPSQRSTMALLLIGPMFLGLLSHAVGLVREK